MRNNRPHYGLYIHWPFCAAKCPYCDFNSHVRKTIDEDRFINALITELRTLTERTGPITLKSIFFGGGTPSLMSAHAVEKLITAAQSHAHITNACEITLEANPSSVEADRFQGYKTAGVNRISIGVQSLYDEELKKLGRLHTAEEARTAIKTAEQHFERYSIDLIYARPHQTRKNWQHELQEAVKLARGHMSLYQLTIEPNTPYAALHKRGKLITPDAEHARALYEDTAEIMGDHGYDTYEISNYAQDGHQSIHNRIYWTYQPYLGIGPGAHGRIIEKSAQDTTERTATATHLNPEIWASHVEQHAHGLSTFETLTHAERADEMLLMGLRLRDGINLDAYQNQTGRNLNKMELHELMSLGLLQTTHEGNIAATQDGALVLDAIIADLTLSATDSTPHTPKASSNALN